MTNIPSRLCQSCGQKFFKPYTCSRRSWKEDYKSCSRSCARIGKPSTTLGMRGRWIAWNKGIPFSKASRKKMSLAKKGKSWTETMRKNIVPALRRGIDHPLWKGEKVGYMALHSWVKRELGKADHCEDCGLKKKPKIGSRGQSMISKKSYFEWANVSNKYLRDLSDWKSLCTKCHAKYDRKTSVT